MVKTYYALNLFEKEELEKHNIKIGLKQVLKKSELNEFDFTELIIFLERLKDNVYFDEENIDWKKHIKLLKKFKKLRDKINIDRV